MKRQSIRESFTFERRISVSTAVIIVSVVVYLVIRNQPFTDLNLIILLRIILAVSMGIIGATIPGFLTIEYSAKGVVIRAAGALALTIICYFGTPKVDVLNLKLPPATIKIEVPKKVDVRSSVSPDEGIENQRNAPIYVTVDMTYRNEAQPGYNAFLKGTTIKFTINGTSHELNWLYFVNMHPEQDGNYLGIKNSAGSQSIDQGRVLPLEILHGPTQRLTWSDFLKELNQTQSSTLKFTILSEIDDEKIETNCTVDNVPYWRQCVNDYITSHDGRLPSRLTMCCSENPNTSSTLGCNP